MFKKTIAKAAIGALAISGVATQAAWNHLNFYGGIQPGGQFAVPHDKSGSTTDAAWKDFFPSKLADLALSGRFGAAINPSLTYNVPLSVEVIAQIFPSEIAVDNIVPDNKNEKIGETAEKVQEATSEMSLNAAFLGAQGKVHAPVAESLDFIVGAGLGGLMTKKIGNSLAITSHVGAEYHLTDNVYIPFNVQYAGNPWAKSEDVLHHWTFNIGAHYHF